VPTALVTGASRGFGRALADALARRGWDLIVDARDGFALNEAAAELARHGPVVAVAGDLVDPAHRAALAEAVRDADGIDLLVHNASTLGASPLPPLDRVLPEVFERTYAVNLFAPVALTQALAPHLRAGATVVAVTSDAAVEPYAGWGAYGGSKAALEHTFAIWAAERPDLTILVVDPGDMRTRMHQDAFPDEDISDRPLPEDRVPGLLALLDRGAPSGRHRLADELAGAR
jgi:NAD(P)-dependent dehydrogenase (short-subunit alcohol dehydrogenase family)